MFREPLFRKLCCVLGLMEACLGLSLAAGTVDASEVAVALKVTAPLNDDYDVSGLVATNCALCCELCLCCGLCLAVCGLVRVWVAGVRRATTGRGTRLPQWGEGGRGEGGQLNTLARVCT